MNLFQAVIKSFGDHIVLMLSIVPVSFQSVEQISRYRGTYCDASCQAARDRELCWRIVPPSFQAAPDKDLCYCRRILPVSFGAPPDKGRSWRSHIRRRSRQYAALASSGNYFSGKSVNYWGELWWSLNLFSLNWTVCCIWKFNLSLLLVINWRCYFVVKQRLFRQIHSKHPALIICWAIRSKNRSLYL